MDLIATRGRHAPRRGGERRLLLRLPVRAAQGQGRHPPVRRHHRRDEGRRARWPRRSAEELGIDFGETTPDGKITLEHTPCIGMCDQAPAALVNDVVVTNLTSDKAREIVASCCKARATRASWSTTLGDGNNAHELVQSHGQQQHPQDAARSSSTTFESGAALKKALAMTPGRGDPRRQDLAPARPRRRRLPDRHEVGVHPPGRRATSGT